MFMMKVNRRMERSGEEEKPGQNNIVNACVLSDSAAHSPERILTLISFTVHRLSIVKIAIVDA